MNINFNLKTMEKKEEKETEKTIFNLEMHEVLDVSNDIMTFQVMRVPGGWLYIFYRSDIRETIFVPMSKDINPIKDFDFSIV